MIGVGAPSSPDAGVLIRYRCAGRVAGRHTDSCLVAAATMRWLDVGPLIRR